MKVSVKLGPHWAFKCEYPSVHILNVLIRLVGTYINRTYTQLDALIRLYTHLIA